MSRPAASNRALQPCKSFKSTLEEEEDEPPGARRPSSRSGDEAPRLRCLPGPRSPHLPPGGERASGLQLKFTRASLPCTYRRDREGPHIPPHHNTKYSPFFVHWAFWLNVRGCAVFPLTLYLPLVCLFPSRAPRTVPPCAATTCLRGSALAPRR